MKQYTDQELAEAKSKAVHRIWESIANGSLWSISKFIIGDSDYAIELEYCVNGELYARETIVPISDSSR